MLNNDGEDTGVFASWFRAPQPFSGDGLLCGDEKGGGVGRGAGYGYGGGGCGYGTGVGHVTGDGYGIGPYDTAYVVSLVIDCDPVTTAYQSRTLQTTGAINDQK